MPVTQYQNGSLDRIARAKGPDVWVFRWRETVDGKRIQRKQNIGTLDQYPTAKDATCATENLRSKINADQDRAGKLTILDLWGHFQANELSDPDVDRSPTTIEVYLDNFKRYILPKWGETFIVDVKAVKVERWLRTLSYAPATKSKFRNQLSMLFSHAIRHELYQGANPIAMVRQGSKRVSVPDILSLPEMGKILSHIGKLWLRAALLLAAVTGLRRSEMRGLKWFDIDTAKLWINLRRGVVKNWTTKLKTEASRTGIPIPQDLADVLNTWRQQSPYQADDDWVFASPAKAGRSPIWFDVALQRHIRPAAKAAGITGKKIGWHTFRRSLATLLSTSGENIKAVQELLRHANPITTMALYQQADVDAKRAAQCHTAELFILPLKVG
jgi:integrase